MIIVLAMILLTGQTVAATTEPITLTLSSKGDAANLLI